MNNTSIFTVISNNGCIEDFTNSCFWISICDFLKYNKNYKDISVKSLRNISKFPGKNNEMIDYIIPEHLDSMKKICNYFNFGIDFHYVNKKIENNKLINLWLGKAAFHINKFFPVEDRCAIACYGDHFELIISKTENIPKKQINNLPADRKIITFNIQNNNFNKKYINELISKYNEYKKNICELEIKLNILNLQKKIYQDENNFEKYVIIKKLIKNIQKKINILKIKKRNIKVELKSNFG